MEKKLVEVFMIDVYMLGDGVASVEFREGYPDNESIKQALITHHGSFANVRKIYRLEDDE